MDGELMSEILKLEKCGNPKLKRFAAMVRKMDAEHAEYEMGFARMAKRVPATEGKTMVQAVVDAFERNVETIKWKRYPPLWTFSAVDYGAKLDVPICPTCDHPLCMAYREEKAKGKAQAQAQPMAVAVEGMHDIASAIRELAEAISAQKRK